MALLGRSCAIQRRTNLTMFDLDVSPVRMDRKAAATNAKAIRRGRPTRGQQHPFIRSRRDGQPIRADVG
jgi:hypothetical protein